MKRLLAFPSYIFGPLWIKFSVNNPTYYLEYLLKTQTEDIDAQFLPDGPKLISFLSSILMFLRTFFITLFPHIFLIFLIVYIIELT